MSSMSKKVCFTERGVEEYLDGDEVDGVFNWRRTPELLHVGLADLYLPGGGGGKLATVSTIWLPSYRTAETVMPEFETLVNGLAEHHDDLSGLERWATRAEAAAGHDAVVAKTVAVLETAHRYTNIHVVARDHSYRADAAG
jgi:hypothetical protein